MSAPRYRTSRSRSARAVAASCAQPPAIATHAVNAASAPSATHAAPPPREGRAERERREHERPGADQRDEARLVEVAATGERERRRAREREECCDVKGSIAHGHVAAGAAATPAGVAPLPG